MSETKRVAVVGGGPGGYAAAFRAADLGLSVTLVDMEPNPGGVCLYRGCIPSKALLHIAKLIDETREAAHWGVEFGKPKIHLDKIRAFKEGVVQRLTQGTGDLARLRKVRFIQGKARFTGSSELQVDRADGGSETVVFDHAILATGSEPAMIRSLTIDSPRLMDSTGALELKDIPASLLVVGGGIIGLELGQVYAALGARVTVVEMTPGLLPGVDANLTGILEKRLRSRFENTFVNTRVTELKEQKNGIRARFEGENLPAAEQVFDRVLMAVGRRPNTAGLGLETTRVQITDRGFVTVDLQRRTTDPAIFAIGDVAGEPMLAHKGSHEGIVAAEVIAGKKAAFEPIAIPGVVYTDPEVAWCGLTENQAKTQGRSVKVVRFPWAASGRAITLDRPEGLTKLIVDPETERVLGMGIVGTGAGELIAEGVLAVEMAALVSDLALSIHPHPTLSETVMEAAEAFYGHATHIFNPKKSS
ncbi:MAG: dihydrolipoyl dehydrogenase [candidate division Zixibacteria bacterium]|nr:dihydrolipoyl dehydrogenase [candidate division Zixibacteria bacterium]